jgi:hypothetical protein
MLSARLFLRRGIAMAAVLLVAAADLTPASAQQRRTLFDMIFNDPPQQRRQPSIIEREPRRQRSRQPAVVSPSRPSAPAARAPAVKADAAPAPVEKMESARKILVVGDFTALGVAKGLEAAFAEDPSVLVVEKGSGSSGLVRQDFHDWPQELPALIDEFKPAMVVVMIGANDRQAMTIGPTREKFRTDAWLAEYDARVGRVAGLVQERKLPLLWVGLPAFQSPSLTADAVTLNGIYRQAVEKAGGEFIDIWDGFVSESGQFIVTGSDINGQQVRLRSADGIGFTEAGKRKLAFYVEKVARRHLGELGIGDLIRLDAGNLPILSSLPPEAEAAVPSQPISLSDPELDGGRDLLGGTAPQPSITETPRNLLLTRGQVPDAPVGRVDYYSATVTGTTP